MQLWGARAGMGFDVIHGICAQTAVFGSGPGVMRQGSNPHAKDLSQLPRCRLATQCFVVLADKAGC